MDRGFGFCRAESERCHDVCDFQLVNHIYVSLSEVLVDLRVGKLYNTVQYLFWLVFGYFFREHQLLVVIASTFCGHASVYLIAVLSKTDCNVNTCIVHPNPPAGLDPEYTGRYPHAYKAWTFFSFFFLQYFKLASCSLVRFPNELLCAPLLNLKAWWYYNYFHPYPAKPIIYLE